MKKEIVVRYDSKAHKELIKLHDYVKVKPKCESESDMIMSDRDVYHSVEFRLGRGE